MDYHKYLTAFSVFLALSGSLFIADVTVAEAKKAAAPLKPLTFSASQPFEAEGVASWFGARHHGKTTASGESFDMFAMTAAHKQLPFGTVLEVTNTTNGKQLLVRVNDRGPFSKKRIIDLSYGAAHKLGMSAAGTAPVEVKTVGSVDGLPLNQNEAFYVSVDGVNTKSTPRLQASLVKNQVNALQNQLSRFFRVGLYDEAKLLSTAPMGIVVGPFNTFQDAHASLMKLNSTHPNACITLANRKDVTPASSVVAAKM